MRYTNIPSELKQLNRWLCVWKNSKIPMQATHRKGASSVSPETWSTFSTAESAVEGGYYDDIGFVFNGDGYIGIDIDAGFDEDGFLSPLSIDVMNACKSYTETSRSGRGIHIILKGRLPFEGKNNRNGVEIYKTGRYFIMTGKKLIYDKIIENQAAIDYVVDKYFYEFIKESTNSHSQRIYSPEFTLPDANGKISLDPKFPTVQPGMRNISLTSLAGQYHNQGYTRDFIYNKLSQVNQAACKPPLPENEIETIVNSVTRYRR